MDNARDHIFISYATEDVVLADWLARKLAAAGYAVWYDRLKLLGGEPWPQDIDDAIKTRTFRMLGLLSRASLSKPNPTKERTLAQQLGRDRGVPDFLIPLNVEGLRPSELTWTLSDTNFLSFEQGWASGLAAVLRKLTALGAPQPLRETGASLAIASFQEDPPVLLQRPEPLLANCFPIEQVPSALQRFQTKNPVTPEEVRPRNSKWPCRRLSDHLLLAFEPPPDELAHQFGIEPAGGAYWPALSHVDHVPTRDLVVSLIHASLDAHFAGKGLVFSEERKQWYLPDGLVEGNRLRLTRPDSSSTWVLSVGQRTFGPGVRAEPYRYHLSPSFTVLRSTSDPFLLVLRTRVYFTAQNGAPLAGRKVVSRRKHLGKNWWNEEWLNRTLALIQFLSDGRDSIRIGQLLIAATPLSAEVPFSIDDHRALSPDDTTHLASRSDDDHEEEDDETDKGSPA